MTAWRTYSPHPRPQPAAIHGSCKWLGLIDGLVLDAGVALLSVTTATGTREYWVRRVKDDKGRVSGYTLTKEDGEQYLIDLSFGGGWEHASCDCGDATHRRFRPGGCRHIAAARKALEAAGVS
jgi:hypothetical protein